MTQYGPIGIFDSGYGGLTVFQSIASAMPEYDYIYLGDNARTPYGTRSFEAVHQYTLEGVKYLFSKGCKLIILACNTASAKALREIQQRDLPRLAHSGRVLGVIRPTTEVIGNYTNNGTVGILATTGTVQSQSYPIEIKKFFPDIRVFQQACPIWVPLVENNEWNTEGGVFFIKKYLDELFSQAPEIDTLLLGCTHYPLLKEMICAHLPEGCALLTQGKIIADSLIDYLHRHPEIDQQCSKNGEYIFLTTDIPEKFDLQAPLFLKHSVRSQQVFL